MGDLHFFFGIEVYQVSKGLMLSQQSYLQDMLRGTKIKCTLMLTPMLSNPPLSKD